MLNSNIPINLCPKPLKTTKMLNWTIEKIFLDLKFTWKLSRNSATTKTNFYIKVKENNHEGIGEVAPNIRYGETPESVLSEFGMILNNELPIVKNLEQLNTLLKTFEICQSLRCGIETAYIDLQCKKNNTSVFDLFKLKKITSTPTAFTIPIMEIGKLSDFFLTHNLHRFKHIKVKIDAENALETIKEVNNITDQPLLIDANEAWTDVEQLLKFIDKIKHYNISFIEQPMPAQLDDQYFYLKFQTVLPIFADESVIAEPDFVKIKRQFHGINIKLMKSGGIVAAKKQLDQAKLFGLQTMIGCMVETTVGIKNGFCFAGECDYVDLDSFMYLANDESKKITESIGILNLVQK